MFAGNLGIDIWEAIDAASTKPFGYMRFTPGPGVGGHCLPIDPSYLSWRVKSSLGQSFRFVELANDVNDHMPDYVVRRLQEALNERRQAGERQSRPAPGADVQEEHERCSRVARYPRGAAARRDGRRGARRRSARPRDTAAPRRARRSHGEGARGIRRRRSCSRTTTPSTSRCWSSTRRSFSTLALVSTAHRSSACSSRRLAARVTSCPPHPFRGGPTPHVADISHHRRCRFHRLAPQ